MHIDFIYRGKLSRCGSLLHTNWSWIFTSTHSVGLGTLDDNHRGRNTRCIESRPTVTQLLLLYSGGVGSVSPGGGRIQTRRLQEGTAHLERKGYANAEVIWCL